jgi:hypothetical protein
VRRSVTFLGFAVVALLLVFAPAADATLAATDTATGTGALAAESGGANNTADGYRALRYNTTGSSNTAVGRSALRSNTKGGENAAVGVNALLSNSTGNHNAALGSEALKANTAGGGNTALGFEALSANQVGFGNTALGIRAGVTNSPANANTSGSGNTFVGFYAGPGTTKQLSNATAVGSNAVVSASDSLVLGDPDVKAGVGTTAPASRFEVGVPSSSYDGDYLQIPIVTNTSPPPAADCGPTFAGRLILQYDAQTASTKLWSCSPTGSWTQLAQGG